MNAQQFLFNYEDKSGLFTVRKIYVDLAGDLTAGMLLGQIVYYYMPSKTSSGHNDKLRVQKDGHYWLAKQRGDWWDEIRITERQYDHAIEKLKKVGLVETRVFKFAGVTTTHIRLHMDLLAYKVQQALGWESLLWEVGNHTFSNSGITDNVIPYTENTKTKNTNHKDSGCGSLTPEQENFEFEGKEKQSKEVGELEQVFTGVAKYTTEEESAMNASEILAGAAATKSAKLSVPATKLSEIYTRWQTHAAGENGYSKPLTAKDKGQLKLLYVKLGEQTSVVLDYVFGHWDHFTTRTKSAKDLSTAPDQPLIGFLLAHHDIAVQLIAKKEAANKKPIPTISIDKPNKASKIPTVQDKPSAEALADSLALFNAIAKQGK